MFSISFVFSKNLPLVLLIFFSNFPILYFLYFCANLCYFLSFNIELIVQTKSKLLSSSLMYNTKFFIWNISFFLMDMFISYKCSP